MPSLMGLVLFACFLPDRHSPRDRHGRLTSSISDRLWATFRLDRVRRAASPAKGFRKSIGLQPALHNRQPALRNRLPALRNRLPALAVWRNSDLRPAPLQVTSCLLPSTLEIYAL
jgi:hypothetical protein